MTPSHGRNRKAAMVERLESLQLAGVRQVPRPRRKAKADGVAAKADCSTMSRSQPAEPIEQLVSAAPAPTAAAGR